MNKFKRQLSLALSYLPSKLPVGLTEFNSFSDSIINLSGEFADRDSMKWAIASQIMHLPPQKSTASKQYFIRSLRKAAANQVASQVFQDLKIKQQEAIEAAKTLEATTTLESVNEQQETQVGASASSH